MITPQKRFNIALKKLNQNKGVEMDEILKSVATDLMDYLPF